ncbi:PLP-dependent aminotransferase family protein [Affinibrenneria salicis]|uniref:PLP-dependent aminotransferase family protein n=1 Tax=Affinibrenneria salicis TaxID=2590031 RepID=A0A5J5G1H0_9GAMM|nr:PLP-dependent aminotransferase family protein [Affinibrenneria salicis]KAA9000525.1 PLP-dependent aminotransferase family protein [Affinibrenneria salicis]
MIDRIYERWASCLRQQTQRPAYLLIADLIADGVNNGEFQARDRLPPLRELAVVLSLNYTTVTRGYAEARKRGLIDSRPGMGSFIRGKVPAIPLSSGSSYDMTMNSPIEPAAPDVAEAIRQGALNLFAHKEIYSLLRYQDFGGTLSDKEAAMIWLGKRLPKLELDEVLVCPGIHSVLVALVTLLGRKGGEICVGSLIYPGLKAIASQLNITLRALECDGDGPLPRAFENQCQTGQISALYLNPTINNPTTITVPLRRRESLADIALRYSVPIIEDDAYSALPERGVAPFAELAPELTWHITGLSKCFGAGLRIAYVKGPGRRSTQLLAGALRALTVMSSPITNALATQWIGDGTADNVLSAIRQEARLRQQLAARHLHKFHYQADCDGFHLWLHLPKQLHWNPSDVAIRLREQGVSAVSSAAFSTDNNPPAALRLCLGGALNRQLCEDNLTIVADLMEYPEHFTSGAL